MSQYLEYIGGLSTAWLALWATLALGVLWLVLRKPRTLVLASSEAGQLEISRRALHRLLETCCQQLQGVASARARVSRSRGKFKTALRLKIRPDAKLEAIQGYLAQEIGEIYRENLGIKEVGPIEIEVVGVVPEEKGF